MMKIDTREIAGYEDRTVILEFEHDPYLDADTPRYTNARLVEFVQGSNKPDDLPGCIKGWRRTPTGWKCTLAYGVARCSQEDQFSREAGRRLALRRLAECYQMPQLLRIPDGDGGVREQLGSMGAGAPAGRALVAGAARQYFENRSTLKRVRAA